MTSPTNTAGLVAEIDAEMQGRRRGYADVRGELLFRCRDSLVTAASAQARIEALTRRRDELLATTNAYQARYRAAEARVAELEAAKWEAQHADTMNDLVAMGLARDAAEARADRLADGITAAMLILTPEPGDKPLTDREKTARQLLAALQDQPK